MAREVCLYPATEILKKVFYEEGYERKRYIGRIDLIFRWHSQTWIAEVKYYPFDGNGDFWAALKVVGYTELYKWEYNNEDIRSAIMMPFDKVKLEHKLVANKLKIGLFGILEKDKKFIVRPMNFD